MTRVEYLIESLGLDPHPEGGWYREIFRSSEAVQPADCRGPRSALTTIYFLLPRGATSCFHRVRSDEVWHFYEGGPLRLAVCDGDLRETRDFILGPLEGSSQPVHVVPAGCWQAAESLGDYTLVGCSVGPGFDFADFTMLRDDDLLSSRFRLLHPDLQGLI